MQEGVTGFANTLPSKKLLIEGITRDLPIEACIFDLIDNAIDASPKQKQTITVIFNGYKFLIEDNGQGISYEKMEKEALSAGSIEPHDDRIGAFGIGLNRALYKLGKTINIASETESERVTVSNWTIPEYMKSRSWNVPISRQEKQGKKGTSISITDLNDDVSKTLSDNTWVDNLKKEISKRYALFINNGLRVNINGDILKSNILKFRQDSKFSYPKREFKLGDIMVEIICGQHARHRFSNEKGYREKINKQLTSEYGWYVYCNNRGILLNDRTARTGWGTVEHSQHHGFIGMVYFNGPAELLPWSTDKINVDMTNPIYSEALKSMEEAFKSWRTFTGWMRKQMSEQNTGTSEESGTDLIPEINEKEGEFDNVILDSGNEYSETESSDRQSFSVCEHPESWSYLFGPKKNSRVGFKIPQTEKKLLGVVKEVQGLKLKENPCATALLLRVLIEESCKYYRKRNGNRPSIPSKISLAETVSRCVDHMAQNGGLSDKHDIDAIKGLCAQRGTRVLSIEYLQHSIHSSRSYLSPAVLRPFWNDIEPFIEVCFR